MIYLTRDDVLDLHMIAVERYGGRLGIRSQDRLLAVVNAPTQEMFGVELYPDLPSKAAAVGFMLLKNRPFHGGNEATAFLVLLRMLHVNGFALAPWFPGRLAGVLQAVLHSELDRDAFAAWLREEIGSTPRVAR